MKTPGQDRWVQLWRSVALQGDPFQPYQELSALYSQPYRHYHNFRHIADCLTEFDSVKHLAHQPDALELAIWFHDAIYDSHAQDNEEKSAKLAEQRIAEAGGSRPLCTSVTTLVLATKAHDPSMHPDAPLLVDVDLSILGQGEERFEEFEGQIRREYDWVQQPLFATGRAEILERFLARARIYSTDPFWAKYEKQARVNLQRSVRNLKTTT